VAEGVLARIEQSKRSELESRLEGVSLDALRQRATPTKLRLGAALSEPGCRFILEIKKASPSGGTIRPYADAAELARSYAGVADALSVLTDAPFFGGSLGDLTRARSHFDGPVLAKDFFLDPRQVVEARIAGADAVLVMLSLLDDATARKLIDEAERLGMDSLVEVHDEAEMRRANALGAKVIGINNRDLRDLSIDLSTTERLAKFAGGAVLVCESGIGSRKDLERLSPHVNAFLVGSSLMRSADPGEAARELMFGRVKLCGLNRQEDFEAGRAATYAGLVFVPESPRAVSLGQAFRLSGGALKRVGIFRNAPVGDIAHKAKILGLAAVQLHGDEEPDYVRALARRLPRDCEVWKAINVEGAVAGGCDAADRLLFDSCPGGTGRTFDWSAVQSHQRLADAVVAGGIGSHNAAGATALGAHAIDVGSSLDERPGLKSPAKIRALFEALRVPSRQELRQCA
jgi:indole-3-glycerol phosphate synthase/phosphoribosylanthranilate isomerase